MNRSSTSLNLNHLLGEGFMSRSKLAWVGLSLSLVLLVGSRLAARPASPHPLRQTELLALVAGQSLPETIALQIKTRGLDFRPDDVYRALLTTAGADPLILKALDSAKTVPTSSPNPSPATTEPAALQHLANAGKAIRDKKFGDAKNELDAYVGRRSETPESDFVLGILLRQQENFAAAVEAYQQVLRQGSNFPEAHTKLSYVQHRAGDDESALREAKIALEENPDNAEAHKNAGLSLTALNNFDAAKSEYDQALRLKPDYEPIRLDLGIMYSAQGNRKAAIEQY